MTDTTKWCTGALPGGAPAHQEHENSLKALAANALRESDRAPSTHQTEMPGAPVQRCTGAGGAAGASGAGGALSGVAAILRSFAKHIGVPATVVDSMSADDLAATEEQIALCKGHLDGDGNPLARTLLSFYLRALADQSTTTRVS